MSTRSQLECVKLGWLALLLFCWPALSNAQVPVDSNGNPIGDYEPDADVSSTGNEDIPLLSNNDLQELVGPIALYPDDLLAIVLPAATYPLQVVQAGRFLEDLEDDPSLQPDESWDDSVVALTNYPDVVELLNDDLDWTWRLGEAVVAQQADVIAAVETFRDRAYAAGNLKSDDHQTVSQSDGVIEITPVSDDVIYVPYYEPERVVVHQPRPVYYYYPRPYPVYYYPYPSSHAFHSGYFWGVTTAFTLGWHTDRLHVFHHSYHGHPYFGRSYWNRWWYRQPTINVYNNIYVGSRIRRSSNHYRSGDYWQPRARRTVRFTDERVTRTRYYPSTNTQTQSNSNTLSRSGPTNRARTRRSEIDSLENPRSGARPEIRFRDRTSTEMSDRSDRRSRSRASENPPRVTSNRSSNSRRETESRSNFRSPTSSHNVPRETLQRSPSNSRQSRSRNDSALSNQSRQTQARRSEPRQTQSRQTQARRSEPRQTQSRQTQVRRSEPRQQTQSRQTQVRRSEPRQTQSRQTQVRRSEPRQTQSRPSQARQSESRQSQAKSNKVASSGRRERSSRAERRH